MLTLLGSAALVAGCLSGTATAATADGGSQPLPGYTVDNPPLPPLQTPAGPSTVYQGVYHHAAYDVEVPPHWNGELVMWAHPYQGTDPVLTLDAPEFGLRQLLLDEGYAWAGSSFALTGWDVGSGVTSEHDLALYAGQLLHRRPSRIYFAGISMGSQVVARSLEQYPHLYAGALPMCGVLGDDRMFDYVADVNLVAQDLAGVHAYPFPADYQSTVVPAMLDRLGLSQLAPGEQPANPLGRQLEAVTVNRAGGERPGVDAAFTYWANNGLFYFGAPDDGGPLIDNVMRLAQNAVTRYAPNSPVNVNATVQRITPEDLADRLNPGLTAIPRVFGDPSVPVLTLHDSGDLLVPLSMEQDYARRVAAHGTSNLLVQRVIRGADHCDFSPNEVADAWHSLVRWVLHGPSARPAGDDVLDPAVLASPGYGCRFTDESV
ncbi:MAG TPA: hypothetical protein VMB79_09500, partial [Jatrophihabitans sp.]|nr:hypothetical protein [Jatrophihabitans sp.]